MRGATSNTEDRTKKGGGGAMLEFSEKQYEYMRKANARWNLKVG